MYFESKLSVCNIDVYDYNIVPYGSRELTKVNAVGPEGRVH